MANNYTSKINVFLADQIVFFIKLHNLHWFIKGPAFFTLHAEYEKLYDEVNEVLDEVAERLLQLDVDPVASIKEAKKIATLEERESGAVDAKDSVKLIIEDFEKLEAAATEIIRLSAEAGDEGTADQFTGYLRSYSKILWMLKSYLK